MLVDIFKEKTPLTERDTFLLFERTKASFTFPVHTHEVWELNFVEHAAGARRVVGDSDEIIGEQDLVLIANTELEHAWLDGACRSRDIHEITIQFPPTLFDSPVFQKKQFDSIMRMMAKAEYGLAFGESEIRRIQPYLRMIATEKGFYSVMKFFILLYELSLSHEVRTLSSKISQELSEGDRLMQKMLGYIEKHLAQTITTDELANYLGMSSSTFFRFLKRNTRHSFTEFLQEYRINRIVHELNSNSKDPIMDIASRYGFVSQSYFYKVFRKYKGITPQEYRENYQRVRVIV